MLGAIIGDYVGSAYEFDNTNNYSFDLITPESEITDDSILTLAIADAILQGKPYAERLHYWGNKYPNPMGSYGGSFGSWLRSDNPQPYNSWGNGSAMRVSPIGWAFDTLEEVQREAQRSAQCTHNHPEGIKGAMAVASAIFLTRNGESKEYLKHYIEKNFDYNLSRKLAQIRPTYQFYENCMQTVPEAIICYLESNSFEDAIRLAVSLGGDSDTIACITGSIAEATPDCGIPMEVMSAALSTVPSDLKAVFDSFYSKYRLHLPH
ncbi:ADP-ribosyl-[dinitrogen reductase] hydrolase [Dysgonomonas sp. PFB1-18]|uniref:ADP-ribosylglycohydrolase family protein n=1 Tax=unclassified Dysgonomonas TaxID=2630389 RepID=UPI002474A417|nr:MULTISPECIES: ADP-ribosylglycohydrolase family protein [unclassified Dysgonomonas]MDH6308106.1 ADP-ribosyl-[dinitrogen reductase] hydrolase [Dysgonomonas sp. PF1-14]MDH6339645.1 ADP-ribosyl-[dinitrogen reductase] hydrolase [Dysgonomonas sp. PF1-16]MDH6381296.1 ADP-ribosyl-[dinitrogen reductase] hydrolase [Dysgonomonas sp. PFB1-18]MDH6398508.1 ADP-ribosyl-[dinitrogen reductase] hydrolase [Dysgonomonas sp. PF1-23]